MLVVRFFLQPQDPSPVSIINQRDDFERVKGERGQKAALFHPATFLTPDTGPLPYWVPGVH